ncbi:hypothetical protein [Salipiger profundus]|uniref:hypothetical protein n=1 Tax=Salipiger profundus TaxID=1229727 RepID=UPI0008E77B1E|nr:hypothetical protein [Salipiger profundus]SFD16932.1 hypothetical protein SAMN05444415_10834 [Salipiger profundus]
MSDIERGQEATSDSRSKQPDGSAEHQQGEVLDPEVLNGLSGNDEQAGYIQNILALVDNYSDRPDLLIAEIEKHDPGFVKRMNEASERDSEELRKSRFKFGRFQAYVGVGISVLAAIAVLAAVVLAVINAAGFGTIIALAVLYAVTQGGTRGFRKIIDSVVDLVRGRRPETKD